MAENLGEAFGFEEGDKVRMLVETGGDDGNSEYREYPAGTEAYIDRIDRFDGVQGIAFTLIIGPRGTDESIANIFDENDGPVTEFFVPLNPQGTS